MFDDMIEKARVSQTQLSNLSDEQVDEIICSISKVIYDNAEIFSLISIEETRIITSSNKNVMGIGEMRDISEKDNR